MNCTVRGKHSGGRNRQSKSNRGLFRKSSPNDPRIQSEVQIFVEGLPINCKVPELYQYFSSVGDIKVDRENKKPRIWLYTNKITGQVNLPFYSSMHGIRIL